MIISLQWQNLSMRMRTFRGHHPGWSSSSPHASFPYPSTPPIIEACWQHQDQAPDRSQPALPDSPCHCGLLYTNAYVRVNKACCILYAASQHTKCECKQELFELQSPNHNPACTVVYDGIDDDLFHFSNKSRVSLWLLYQYADQFQNDGKSLSASVHDQYEVYPQHSHTSLRLGLLFYSALEASLSSLGHQGGQETLVPPSCLW